MSMTINWTQIGTDISLVGTAVSAVIPASSAVILLVTKIVQGVVDEVPEAVAIYEQITSGTPVTAAQLAGYQSSYEAAYQQLNSDIVAALAALPAGS